MNYVNPFLFILLFVNLIFSQQWQIYRVNNSMLPDNHVNSIYIDSDGLKWFSTKKGLASYNNNKWNVYNNSGIIDQGINSLTENTFNAAPESWLATDKGILVFESNTADSAIITKQYTIENSDLSSDVVFCVYIDSSLIKWIGNDHGLSVLKDDVWENYPAGTLVNNAKLKAIVPNKNGINYVATEGGGVNRLRSDVDGITAASPVTSEWFPLLSDTVNSIFFDSNENKWFGTKHGVSKVQVDEDANTLDENVEIDGNRVNWTESYTTSNGLIDNNVFSMAEDNENDMWFGSANGLSRLSNEKWTNWNSADSLPGDSIYDIAVDFDGSIWLATNNGVANFRLVTSILVENKNTTIQKVHATIFPNPFNMQTTFTY